MVGGQRAELKGYFHRVSTQGERWKTALDLTQTRGKGSPPEKHFPTNKKELLTFFGVMVKKGVADDGGNDDE